jgi:uncharacterized membrane protein YkoI
MKPFQKLLASGALAGLALAGGAVGANMIGTAGAATSSDSSSTTVAAPSDTSADANTPAQPPAQAPSDAQGQRPAPDWSHGGHQANGKTETLLTGDDASKAKAAAEAAVPGATAQRIETDADGDAYEVHMTKSDGSIVTVKLDANFAVTQTIDGMG